MVLCVGLENRRKEPRNMNPTWYNTIIGRKSFAVLCVYPRQTRLVNNLPGLFVSWPTHSPRLGEASIGQPDVPRLVNSSGSELP